jgi:CHAT domain-containing protein
MPLPPWRFRFSIFALLVAGLTGFAQAKEVRDEMAAGEALFERGQFAEAIERWRVAARGFERAKDPAGQIHALMRQASASQALGQRRLTVEALREAEALAEQGRDRRLMAEVKATKGAMAIYAREADQAEPLLREALKMARTEKATTLIASIQNSLGIVLSGQEGKSAEALAAFDEAATLAQRAGDPELSMKARKNAADTAVEATDFPRAEKLAGEVASGAATVHDAHARAFLLMGAAQVFEKLFIDAPAHDNALRGRAFKLYEEAAQLAGKAGDQRALAYALGYEGAMYQMEKRDADALLLTRRAVFAAQQAHSPDALYRLERQAGRLLAKEHDRDAAILAYRRAVATLQGIRNDVSMRYGNRNARSSFREAAGGTFFELADLLLQRADTLKPGDELQALLREARDTAEKLKAAELEDYFQDDCVNVLKSKTKKVESLSPKAAIVYIIALPTRTELLVSLPSGQLERFKSEVTDEQLTESAREFRQNLEDRTSEGFYALGQQLYTWLIKPFEALMAEHGLDTMVFVPDGALRTIPMAALYDGEKFLIEKYAIAVTPGLELMEAHPSARMQPRVMISGLSEARDGFPPLVNVPEEIAALQKVFGESSALLNQQFLHDTVGAKIAGEPFTIVHIASHGHFDDDVRKSFVLTFDKHLTLDDLERYIRPAQLRDQGLELLTLSACQTAAGDDRAALGLAGIAVKAGARSAFATLWFVNDAASTKLVSDFYAELKTHAERTKAQALQTAQVALLKQEKYAHPCFWAPYLLIGNWL